MADYNFRRRAQLRSAVQRLVTSIGDIFDFVEDDCFPFDEEFVDNLIAIEKAALRKLGQEEGEEDA